MAMEGKAHYGSVASLLKVLKRLSIYMDKWKYKPSEANEQVWDFFLSSDLTYKNLNSKTHVSIFASIITIFALLHIHKNQWDVLRWEIDSYR